RPRRDARHAFVPNDDDVAAREAPKAPFFTGATVRADGRAHRGAGGRAGHVGGRVLAIGLVRIRALIVLAVPSEQHHAIGGRAHRGAFCLRGERNADVRALMTEVPRLAAVVSLPIFVEVGIPEVDARLTGNAVDGPGEAQRLVIGGATRPRFASAVVPGGARIGSGTRLARRTAISRGAWRTCFIFDARSSLRGAFRTRGVRVTRHAATKGSRSAGRPPRIGAACVETASTTDSTGTTPLRAPLAAGRAACSPSSRVRASPRGRVVRPRIVVGPIAGREQTEHDERTSMSKRAHDSSCLELWHEPPRQIHARSRGLAESLAGRARRADSYEIPRRFAAEWAPPDAVDRRSRHQGAVTRARRDHSRTLTPTRRNRSGALTRERKRPDLGS